MKYLVDTHILLWSFIEPARLSENVQKILLNETNDIYYSPINLWEISIKYGLGKLKLDGLTPEEFFDELTSSYYKCKHVEEINIVSGYNLPLHHKDPFDRLLIWDAIKSGTVFISADEAVSLYRDEGLNLVTNT
jgi:PIN domain nuclease of toxin-antitoxin system